MVEKPRWFGKAVLVVEDDFDLRDALGDIVRDSGRSLLAASDGAEALRMLDSDTVPLPCLVILDWVMVGMSGNEFLSELATRAYREEVGVIVTSATPGVEVPQAPGVLAFLQKPFEAQELTALLDRFC